MASRMPVSSAMLARTPPIIIGEATAWIARAAQDDQRCELLAGHPS